MMDVTRVLAIIAATTRIIRKKGRPVGPITSGCPEMSRYEFEIAERLVDVHFAIVAVDAERALAVADEIQEEWGALVCVSDFKGPTFLELGAVLGDHRAALRFLALGETIGMWKVVIPSSFDIPSSEYADQLAEEGLVMASQVMI